MNKLKITRLLFSALFIATFVFTSVASAATYTRYCSSSVGTGSICTNTISNVSDDLTYFSNTLKDRFRPTDAYHIKFTDASTYPSVTRGAPIYKNYVLYDNKNDNYYTYDNWNGDYLNDYYSMTLSINKTTGYYPGSYQRPVTNLQIKSGDAVDCSAKIWACNTYSHASQFSVN